MSDGGRKSKKDKGKGDGGAKGGGARGGPAAAAFDSVFDMPDLPRGLPPEVELARTRVICGPDFNSNTEDYSSANAFMVCGVDNAFSLDKFKQDFSIDVTAIDEHSLTFEMKGVGPAIANAFRRILLAEVPTMAIEKVFVVNNTSVIPDEVLAHRLGLVPLAVDPSLFEFRSEGDAANEHNTVVLRLAMRCTRGADGEMRNAAVTSGDLEWLPLGSALPEETDAKLTAFSKSQATMLATPAAAVHADILLAKMRPGQEIELEAHAVKGKGKTHAKWSPVGTAWYELCPEIVTLEPLAGDEAAAYIAAVHPPEATRERQTCFALSGDGSRTLRVTNSRGCWYCREKVRTMSGDARWAPYVQLRRVKEHYLFTIESVGQMPPGLLFTEAVDILREKCLRLNVNLSE